MTDSADTTAVRFEEGLAALETLVAALESGELPLEDALRSFEAGVGLIRLLNAQLATAEQRVEILTRGVDGRLQSRPADDGEL
ncbi:MAG: exodeoxyribonuclease VII small subunit [bacterium]